jgi:hypothetical protein
MFLTYLSTDGNVMRTLSDQRGHDMTRLTDFARQQPGAALADALALAAGVLTVAVTLF